MQPMTTPARVYVQVELERPGVARIALSSPDVDGGLTATVHTAWLKGRLDAIERGENGPPTVKQD